MAATSSTVVTAPPHQRRAARAVRTPRRGGWWRQRQLGPLGAGCCFVAGTLLQPPFWLTAVLLALVVLLAVPALVRRGGVLAGTRTRPARALIVGHGPEASEEALGLGVRSGNRLQAVAWCDPAGLEDAMARHRPDVVVALPSAGLAGRVLRRITWHLEAAGVPLFVGSRLDDLMPSRAQVVRIGSVGLVHVRPAARARLQRALKSSWERFAALVGVLVMAPVLLLIAMAIKVDSRGPVIFRQERVGRDGHAFTMFKFRTMSVDAEARRDELCNDCDGVLFKNRQDPRVTAVGRVLRRYSFDELPQLFNVIRGQMALVGPRPALFSELARYDTDTLRRLALLPGITGLWQVSGRSDLPWDEAVRLDLDYVDNWSLALDARILVRTARAVLGHTGAY